MVSIQGGRCVVQACLNEFVVFVPEPIVPGPSPNGRHGGREFGGLISIARLRICPKVDRPGGNDLVQYFASWTVHGPRNFPDSPQMIFGCFPLSNRDQGKYRVSAVRAEKPWVIWVTGADPLSNGKKAIGGS